MSFTNNQSSVIQIKLGLVTAYVLKGEKSLIIDTGYPGNTNKILHYLQKNRIEYRDISLIIITHGHIDHYGSAQELKKITGAPIAMHRLDAEYVGKGINYIGTPVSLLGNIMKKLFIRKNEVFSMALKLDLILENDLNLEEYGIVGRIIHTPGHTPGSISIILSNGVAIVGDLIMGGILLRKVPHYPLFINNISIFRESLLKILKLSPKTIYASHGGPFSDITVEKFLQKTMKK